MLDIMAWKQAFYSFIHSTFYFIELFPYPRLYLMLSIQKYSQGSTIHSAVGQSLPYLSGRI